MRSTAPSPLDPLIDKINPDKWYEIVEKEPSKLEEKLISKSEKTLPRLVKQEEKIYKKQLETKDSLLANRRLADLVASKSVHANKLSTLKQKRL
jgi:hypothetical protein